MDVLEQVLNPASYLDAAETTRCAVDDLPPGLLVVRLTVALADGDLVTAEQLIERLDRLPAVGYEAFQTATASLWIAACRNDQAAFDRALDGWLEGRRRSTSAWDSTVLEAPEFATMLAAVEPSALAAPMVKRRAVTRAEKAFVADLVESRLCAVEDNLDHILRLGGTGLATSIAKRYRLVSVDLGLGEATFASKDDHLPDLVVALDQNGEYTGSFVAH